MTRLHRSWSSPVTDPARMTATIDRPLAWVRSVTGKLTMYRLVLSCLIGLAVISIIASVVGAVTYPPLALLATLSMALVAS